MLKWKQGTKEGVCAVTNAAGLREALKAAGAIITEDLDIVTNRKDLESHDPQGIFRTDDVDIRDWFEDQVQRGMPHHVCIVEGHHGELLHRVGRLMGAIAR